MIGELAEMEEAGPKSEKPSTGLILVVAGIAVMAAGGWVALAGAERLVASLGVSDSVVGLSIVALATTAELLALAVSAHRHRVGELAVAGIVGSVGYNATMTLGAAALAKPLVVTGIGRPAWLAVGLPVIIIGLGGRAGELRRWGGGLLLAAYVVYLIALYI